MDGFGSAGGSSREGPPTKNDWPHRILVVDDEPPVANEIAMVLERAGFEVVGPAPDCGSALDRARSEKPDIALVDVRVPGPGGLSCAGALWRELGIPTVILGASAAAEHVNEALRAEVFGYVVAPASHEALRAAIMVAWSRAKEHAQHAERLRQLEQTLADRRTIESAKWRIVEKSGLSEAEAHGLLQRSARSTRRRLIEIAREVLADPAHPLLARKPRPE